MKMKSQRLQLSLVIVMLLCLTACEQKSAINPVYPFQHTGKTMGTSFSIKAPVLPETLDQGLIKQQIDRLLVEINAHMSTYLKDSELSKFNRNESTDWQPVSAALFEVLNEAQRISRLSDGAFDMTVGPLVNLWGFGPELMQFEPPTEASISSLLNQTGYKSLKLTESPKAISKQNQAIYLDLSALAKGYAVDQVAALLEKHKIINYLVEIGGELRLKGFNIKGQVWRIAIEKPTADNRMIQRVLPITDIAIATSGDYRNFFEVDGQRFSHTIDPRTGKPITHKLASVTVLRHTSMEADALATALMVLGPKKGLALAEREQIAALFIMKTEAGFKEKSSSVYTQLTR